MDLLELKTTNKLSRTVSQLRTYQLHLHMRLRRKKSKARDPNIRRKQGYAHEWQRQLVGLVQVVVEADRENVVERLLGQGEHPAGLAAVLVTSRCRQTSQSYQSVRGKPVPAE